MMLAALALLLAAGDPTIDQAVRTAIGFCRPAAGSCSAVGASGFTGCQVWTWHRNDQQKGQ